MSPPREHLGTVESFDEARGLGVVRDADGDARPFHCTEIADGSRSIAVGSPVRYRVEWRVLRWEAVDLRPA